MNIYSTAFLCQQSFVTLVTDTVVGFPDSICDIEQTGPSV